MASPTQGTWVCTNSGGWWRTGKPGVLQFMGSQRVRHDLATELNQTEPDYFNNRGQPRWASHPHQPQCWGHWFSVEEIPKVPGWLCLCPHKYLKASLTIWIKLILPFSWAQMVYYQQFHSIWPKPQTHRLPSVIWSDSQFEPKFKSTGLRVRGSEFKSWVCHFWAVQSLASHLHSLGPSFFICKMAICQH